MQVLTIQPGSSGEWPVLLTTEPSLQLPSLPTEPISATYVCTGVEPSTGTWETSQGPYMSLKKPSFPKAVIKFLLFKRHVV